MTIAEMLDVLETRVTHLVWRNEALRAALDSAPAGASVAITPAVLAELAAAAVEGGEQEDGAEEMRRKSGRQQQGEASGAPAIPSLFGDLEPAPITAAEPEPPSSAEAVPAGDMPDWVTGEFAVAAAEPSEADSTEVLPEADAPDAVEVVAAEPEVEHAAEIVDAAGPEPDAPAPVDVAAEPEADAPEAVEVAAAEPEVEIAAEIVDPGEPEADAPEAVEVAAAKPEVEIAAEIVDAAEPEAAEVAAEPEPDAPEEVEVAAGEPEGETTAEIVDPAEPEAAAPAPVEVAADSEPDVSEAVEVVAAEPEGETAAEIVDAVEPEAAAPEPEPTADTDAVTEAVVEDVEREPYASDVDAAAIDESAVEDPSDLPVITYATDDLGWEEPEPEPLEPEPAAVSDDEEDEGDLHAIPPPAPRAWAARTRWQDDTAEESDEAAQVRTEPEFEVRTRPFSAEELMAPRPSERPAPARAAAPKSRHPFAMSDLPEEPTPARHTEPAAAASRSKRRPEPEPEPEPEVRIESRSRRAEPEPSPRLTAVPGGRHRHPFAVSDFLDAPAAASAPPSERPRPRVVAAKESAPAPAARTPERSHESDAATDVHWTFPKEKARTRPQDVLRRLMEQGRLTRQDIADRFHVPVSRVEEWLRGEIPAPGWVVSALSVMELMKPEAVAVAGGRGPVGGGAPSGASPGAQKWRHPFARIEDL